MREVSRFKTFVILIQESIILKSSRISAVKFKIFPTILLISRKNQESEIAILDVNQESRLEIQEEATD